MHFHYTTLTHLDDWLRLGWTLRTYLYERGGQHCFLLIWPCPDCTPLTPKKDPTLWTSPDSSNQSQSSSSATSAT